MAERIATKILRQRIMISLAIALTVGLLYSRYRGSAWWINQQLGGIFYEIFWCLLAFLIFPTRTAIDKICLWVFGITCGLEFLQLWHPPFLQLIRSYWWGKMLIGTAFDWWDFPYYIIGSALGWVWLQQISRNSP